MKYTHLIVFLILSVINPHNLHFKKNNKKQSIYTLEGKINSTIPAFLWFVMKDSIIIGQIKYSKVKTASSITVIGILTEEGNIRLNEFSKDNIITGIFDGKMINNNFSGTWFSPKTRKVLTAEFKNKDTLLKNVDTVLEAKTINGRYRYMYGKGSAEGSLIVSRTSKSYTTIDFFAVTDAPSRNTAELKIEKVTLSKNEIIYKLEDSEACVFRVRFFKDFAAVNYINNQRDCGFGNSADIDGIYLKVKP